MMIKMSDYVDVKERAFRLRCNIPDGIAILPRNFHLVESREDLIHESSASTVRVLWRHANIKETRIENDDERLPYAEENDFQWLGPIIFISASVLSQNPYAVSMSLNVISNYLTDWFKGIPGNKRVKLDLVVEQDKKKKYVRVHYDGNVEGLTALEKVIHEVQRSE